MEITSDKIIEMANFAIKRAKAAGADGSYVNAGLQKVFSTRFANSNIHQNFVDFETDFSITVIKGKKNVGVSINSLEENEIIWAVDKAMKMVSFLPDDPEYPGVLTEKQDYPRLQLNDPRADNLTPEDITDKIISGINSSHDFSPKVQTVSGNLNLQNGLTYFLSSEGMEYLAPVTSMSSTVNVMAENEKGESRSNSSFGSRRFDDLPFETEGTAVAERAILGLNAIQIDAKEYPVILDFQAVSDQIFLLSYALSAKMIIDQASFLKDKVGEQLFDTSLTVINDPHDPTFLAARALDMEGIASKKYTLINKGVVENFAHSRITASKMNCQSNGSGFVFFGNSFPFPFASKIVAGNTKREKLIEEMDDGLLVTNLHYTNYVDMPRGTLTGMTKDGLFIVKNGEIVGSAKNMRFTDSIPNMFSKTELSKEVLQAITFFGIGFSVPAIKIKSMNFSSQTSH
ncbi:MAG: TldD/PmbA family protein [Candidatus Kariarchaeaceae archaeon]